jgi:alkylation response protein AidB-like acyl-CoA dehydrogenase
VHLDLTPAQEAFGQECDAFARERIEPHAAAIDDSGRFPAGIVQEAAGRGLLGMTLPVGEGGRGLDQVSAVLAIEAIARASATVAVILVVHNALVAEVVARFGTESQRSRWLRRIATGEHLGAFALSEEHAGTDAANQETLARPVDGGWRLTGRKVWVANGEHAAVAIVFGATQPGARGRGITAFLLPLDRRGIARVPGIDSLGVRGLGCVDLVLDEVPVGEEDVLGPVNGGFGVARWALDAGRVGIAAQALGVGQAALDEALAHARTRETFGRPIARYQAIQWFLADMATELEAARWMTWKAAASRDAATLTAAEASMAKLAASEAAHRAADRAMQILASAGYRRGSRVERLFRDARATEIYQGTSEVQRMIVAGAVVGEPGD